MLIQAFRVNADSDTLTLFSPLSDPYLIRVIRFTFYQACLSTLLSVGFAIPVALALSRQPVFKGRQVLLNLFSVSLIIPSVVAIFGIVAVFGRNGWVNHILDWAQVPWQLSLYGLTGILIAHVFFNLPLATRVLLQSLDSVASENWRLAAQLGLPGRSVFRFIEWPAIKSSLPGLCILVFSLCFTSFAIVLTLGGGPKATTIEVAIYQALRFDFDLPSAISLAVIQLLICTVLIIAVSQFGTHTKVFMTRQSASVRFLEQNWMNRLWNFSLIGLAIVFVVTPLVALLVSAINPSLPKVLTASSTVGATLNTVAVAVVSGLLSTSLGIAILSSTRHLRVRTRYARLGKALELPGFAILVVPPVVLGTGLFLLLRPFADVFALALVLVVLVNALMGLPFVIRILETPFLQSAVNYDKLSSSLGMHGLNRWKYVEWPLIRKPLGLALAVSTTLSAGDLTVIALFGSERIRTLSLLLYQRMGSYRLYEAAVTATLLLLLCLFLFWIIERLVGGRHAARR